MMKVFVVLMLVCSVQSVSYKQQCLGDMFDALGDIDDIKLELKCLKEKNKEQAAKLDKQEDQLKEQGAKLDKQEEQLKVKLDNHVNQTDVGKLKKQLQEQSVKLDNHVNQTDVGKLKKQLQELAAKLDKQEDQQKEQSVKLDNHVNQTDVEKLKKQLQEQSVKLDNHVNQTDVGKLKKQLQEQAAKLDKQEDQLKEQSVKLDNHVNQTDVGKLKKQLQEQSVKQVAQQTEVGKLKKQLQGKQVAFATSLVSTGIHNIGPYNRNTPLVFKHVFVNIGNAYSPNTGRFTAPLRGAYHFECHIFGHGVTPTGAALMKNSEQIILAFQRHQQHFTATVSNSVTLLLNRGDVVYMRQWPGTKVYDDYNDHTTFSGHLLFSM